MRHWIGISIIGIVLPFIPLTEIAGAGSVTKPKAENSAVSPAPTKSANPPSESSSESEKATADLLAPVRELVEAENYAAAEKWLKDKKGAKSESDQEKGLQSFLRGYLNFELQKYDSAKTDLVKALEYPGPLEYYIRYFLGRVEQAKRRFSDAQNAYDRLLKLRPPSHLAYKAKFQLSEMSLDQANWPKAFRELAYLERRWRSDKSYPEVVWRLIKVELKRGRKWRACAWARKLYSRYPEHPLVDDWGIDLPSAPFEGKKLDCLATTADVKKRIRRLQWAGKSERARNELETLRQRAKGEPSIYSVDFMMAHYLVNEGYVNEALKILLQHYEKHQKNFNFLKLLGKAAARAGEYQMAVGAYHRAHELNPKSKTGREAMFQSAFLSYQFQDYDGASRKFEQFIKEYPRSGLSRDSEWHLSWIRYLKGDYDGAYAGFSDILEKKKNRRTRRYWGKVSVEKIKYWKAMSLLRRNKNAEAKKIFEAISKDPLWDFYKLAAKYRLEGILGQAKREVASTVASTLQSALIPDGVGMGLSSTTESGSDSSGGSQAASEGEKPNTEEGDESESEEAMGESQDTAAEEGDEADEGEDSGEGSASEEGADSDEDKTIVATDFKDPELRLRFERATLLIRIGMRDWARWELYEIERRTRNPDYLKMLMNAYEQMKSYHRSSYISVVNFSQVRSRRGIDGVRYLWEHAYPRAYSDFVEKYSTDFNVPKEFIWGIMRTESSYRYDIVSPVGAKGLMQLMPNTATQVARLMGDNSFNERFLTDPEVNVRLGTRYLQRLLTKFEGSVPLAAASYNAGPHRVESWLASFGKLEMDEFIEHIPFIETRNYVKKVVRDYGIYESLYAKEATHLSWLVQPIKVQVTRPSPRETWETL